MRRRFDLWRAVNPRFILGFWWVFLSTLRLTFG